VTTVHDPLDFFCGDSWEFPGILQDETGVALPLVGASITWRLDSVDAAINYLALSLGNGISVLNATTGAILVTVSPAQSGNITPGTYKDFLRVTLAEGDVFTEWTGIIRAAANPA
jgi:hypothetical protein